MWTGWASPTKDRVKWGELVHQWVLHCIARCGRKDVERCDWKAWNEPDIGCWQGMPEEYSKLYDFAAEAVKRALPGARVGGPATTNPGNPKAAEFLTSFLTHCQRGKNYPTGKPEPRWTLSPSMRGVAFASRRVTRRWTSTGT